ncbi:MAG: TonB-dependent receptor, partial [Bacteroidales bacterium]|nr:TonB-dependent receptor [Bacteroidales bacterium]
MKVTANNILLLTCLLLYQTGNSLWAQKTDYRLREVVIQGSAKEVRSGAYQITVIDSALLEPGESTDLNTLLAREAGLYFTSYGSTGSLSTLRLRGSGGSHTQVNWNGFPVNSITAGSEDLSLIPVTSLDQISVVEGAPGSRFGSGTFGGAINLDNRPDWTNRFNTRISGGFGSWHYRNSSINIQTGNSRLQYHLSGYQKSAWNNYPFINVYQSGKPLTKRTNDSLQQYGFQQHLFLKLPDQIYIQAGMWGYMHHKDLPESMASTIPGSSTQSDRSLNSYLRLIKQYHNLNM